MNNKCKLKFSSTQLIMLGFFIAILIGSVLLALPISSATGKAVPYIDALFTSTTSICVTGLVTVPTVNTWSLFGQVIILMLIQIGGLGVVTILSIVMISFHKRIGLGYRVLIQDAFNLNTMSGLVKFVKKVIIGTLIIEGIGALFYMIVFIPQYGIKGVWISIFNSVSAFCNAGIDIISENSLCEYVNNPIINFVTIFLIVMGGVGYVVWWDVLNVIKDVKNYGLKGFSKLTLHSKIAISSTFLLIVLGALLILIFEYNNPMTMGKMSFINKVQSALFQSVTTRTAGFFTIPQHLFTDSSCMVSILLMFIGGSPVGTAGGVKTVTITVLWLSAISTLRNKESVALYNRTISKQIIEKCVAVVSMSFIILFISSLMLSAVSKASLVDVVYEVTSATATVGLTRNLTPTLNVMGKIIVMLTMYLGRVGPISLVIVLNTKKKVLNKVKNPQENISVG